MYGVWRKGPGKWCPENDGAYQAEQEAIHAMSRIEAVPITAEKRMAEMEASDLSPDDGLIEVGILKDSTNE